MTNPFTSWKGQPSSLTKSLQNDAVKTRNANSGKAPSLKPRVFNHYQKAVPNVFTQKA